MNWMCFTILPREAWCELFVGMEVSDPVPIPSCPRGVRISYTEPFHRPGPLCFRRLGVWKAYLSVQGETKVLECCWVESKMIPGRELKVTQSLKLYCAISQGARLPGKLAGLGKTRVEECWPLLSTHPPTKGQSKPPPEMGPGCSHFQTDHQQKHSAHLQQGLPRRHNTESLWVLKELKNYLLPMNADSPHWIHGTIFPEGAPPIFVVLSHKAWVVAEPELNSRQFTVLAQETAPRGCEDVMQWLCQTPPTHHPPTSNMFLSMRQGGLLGLLMGLAAQMQNLWAQECPSFLGHHLQPPAPWWLGALGSSRVPEPVCDCVVDTARHSQLRKINLTPDTALRARSGLLILQPPSLLQAAPSLYLDSGRRNTVTPSRSRHPVSPSVPRCQASLVFPICFQLHTGKEKALGKLSFGLFTLSSHSREGPWWRDKRGN